jgi:hypothetical protein
VIAVQRHETVEWTNALTGQAYIKSNTLYETESETCNTYGTELRYLTYIMIP